MKLKQIFIVFLLAVIILIVSMLIAVVSLDKKKSSAITEKPNTLTTDTSQHNYIELEKQHTNSNGNLLIDYLAVDENNSITSSNDYKVTFAITNKTNEEKYEFYIKISLLDKDGKTIHQSIQKVPHLLPEMTEYVTFETNDKVFDTVDFSFEKIEVGGIG